MDKVLEISYDVTNEAAISQEEQFNTSKNELNILNKIKKPVSVAPTHNPKNFGEQIVIYKNGATIRLYVWVDGSWKYTALT